MASSNYASLRPPPLWLTWLARALAAGAAIVITAASLSPTAPIVETGFGDKLDHLAAYAVLALLAVPGWSGLIAPGIIAATAIGFGGLLELLQAFAPGRQPGWADFTVNSLGVLAGWTIASRLRIFRHP
jgi:VanZ family protein